MAEECTTAVCSVGIAIVEDEKELVKVYRKLFERKGITICFVAFDGKEAVTKFIECVPKPRVIVMDYRLPIMNGIEASKEILKLDPDARIIFLSADIGVKEEAMKTGARTFLKKPVGIKDMINAVEAALNRKPLKTA